MPASRPGLVRLRLRRRRARRRARQPTGTGLSGRRRVAAHGRHTSFGPGPAAVDQRSSGRGSTRPSPSLTASVRSQHAGCRACVCGVGAGRLRAGRGRRATGSRERAVGVCRAQAPPVGLAESSARSVEVRREERRDRARSCRARDPSRDKRRDATSGGATGLTPTGTQMRSREPRRSAASFLAYAERRPASPPTLQIRLIA